ncbi:MAG: hypothetical protein KDA69_09920 [Planctomycetaceae bacterium]|nr:hypothetical protein [Planctomycetaceae bacterium]
MRGPGLRVLCDVRRTWKCPQCGYVRRVSAEEASVRCHCKGGETLMVLQEEQRRHRPVVSPLDLFWEIAPGEIELPPYVPIERKTESPPVPDSVESEVVEEEIAETPEEEVLETDDDPVAEESADAEESEGSSEASSRPKKKRRRRNRRGRGPKQNDNKSE